MKNKTESKSFNKRIYQVRTQSGLMGWRSRLQANYQTLEELMAYGETHGVVRRLGYITALQAWNANPIIEGSVNPGDFRKVRN